MDEPPFVDTDVGRASFLLTLEDFAFFVNEFELGDAVPLERLAAQRTQYAAVQLIEIGGDHLDRMLDGGDELGGVIGRSEALVAASQKSVYFLNGSTLLASAAGALELVPDALALLLRRLRYLRGVLPAGQEVLFYLSRLPPPEAGTFGERGAPGGARGGGHRRRGRVARRGSPRRDRRAPRAAPPVAAADANASLHPTLALDAPPPPHLALLCALLSPLLAAALAQLPPTVTGPPRELSLLDPLPTRHLKPDATTHSSAQQLDVPAVVRTLVRLFQRGALHAPPPPPAESALLSAAALLPTCFARRRHASPTAPSSCG